MVGAGAGIGQRAGDISRSWEVVRNCFLTGEMPVNGSSPASHAHVLVGSQGVLPRPLATMSKPGLHSLCEWRWTRTLGTKLEALPCPYSLHLLLKKTEGILLSTKLIQGYNSIGAGPSLSICSYLDASCLSRAMQLRNLNV